MKRLLPITALLLVACGSPTADVSAPTPLIVYVTPEPTATPTPTPTPEPTASPTPEPTPVPVSYDPITFKAATDKKTKPFTISTYGATMKLTASGSASNCRFALVSAFLFPVGETILYSGELSNETCGTTEETEVFLEPGDYYIEWLIANVQGTLTIIPHD